MKIEVQRNNQFQAGGLASKKVFFGDNDRFAIFAVHTRFDSVTWMIADGEQIDEVTGFAKIIRQSDSAEEAMSSMGPQAPKVVVSTR